MTTFAIAFLAGLPIGVGLGYAAHRIYLYVRFRRFQAAALKLNDALELAVKASVERMSGSFPGALDHDPNCTCPSCTATRAAAAKRN